MLRKSDCNLIVQAISSCLRIGSILQIPDKDVDRLLVILRHLKDCPEEIVEDPNFEDPDPLV